MTLLNILKARKNEAARDRNRRRVLLGLEDLEVRKVLSTVAPSGGSFEGMPWTYSENAATHTGTLNFTSKAGSDRIQIQAQHTDLSPGDPGYSPTSNPVNGLTWTNNDDSGGVNITPGTHVNITVKQNAGDDQFVNNDKVDFTLTTAARPSGPTTPTQPPASHPGTPQAGTALGLAWRFAPDGSSTGGGTLYIQDLAKGTDSADPTNQTIWINQDSGHMILDLDETRPAYGPSIASTAKVKVVVAEAAGDINVQNDGLSSGLFSTENRLQAGRISVPYGYLSWTLDSNVVTQKATFTVNSGQADRSTYSIADRYLDLSPGDPGYVANSNPIVGLEVSDSGNDSGGPDFIAGVDPTVKGNIKVVTTGGATFRNSTGF